MSNDSIAISAKKLSKSFIRNKSVQNSLREELMQMWSFGKKKKQEMNLVLDKISFDVKKGEVLGIIGSNGAGKSTLLKILSDITVPDSGEARIYGRVSSLLEVGTGFHRELSGRENIYLNGLILGMSRAEVKLLEEEIIEFSGVADYIDTPIKHYSSGMGIRLAFSVAAHLSADILLIDEVLAVGDAAFQAKCLDKMKKISTDGRTVLFVSHQLNVIQQLCDRCILLKNGTIAANGHCKEVVGQYLQDLSLHHEIFPNEGPLTRISAKNDGELIIIEAAYKVDSKVSVPSFGFVIYDSFGQPITGSNPMIAGVDISGKSYPSTGTVTVKMESPILTDGLYFLSVWFGIDGYRDLIHHDKCISFHVAGMSKLLRKTSAKEIGSATCLCSFDFKG